MTIYIMGDRRNIAWVVRYNLEFDVEVLVKMYKGYNGRWYHTSWKLI